LFAQVAGVPTPVGFHRVADVVLIDSATKYEFRQALSLYLKSHDAAAEKVLRVWLLTGSKNDALVTAAMAQSKDLSEVASQSRSLAAVAEAGLKALDELDQGKALSQNQVAEADAVLKAAQGSAGETEITILPEMTALFHGSLTAEPTSYPLF
jgi:hypothetical protein